MVSRVPAIENMDVSIFYKHWNLRHMPMAGTTSFHPSWMEDSATKALRAYHKRMHEIEEAADGHTHLEAK